MITHYWRFNVESKEYERLPFSSELTRIRAYQTIDSWNIAEVQYFYSGITDKIRFVYSINEV